MWQDILAALGLVLVIEGIFPFLSPGRVRETLSQIIQMDDRTFRILGLTSMLIGLVVLYFVRG
jgi:uncharacterized protein YjeT (DUF2065 family)